MISLKEIIFLMFILMLLSINDKINDNFFKFFTNKITILTILDFYNKYWLVWAPTIDFEFKSKYINTYFPNLLELWFLAVFALPKAYNTGFHANI